MACCLTARSHHVNWCWLIMISSVRSCDINALMLWWNGCNFTDNIFKYIFFYEYCILIQIPFKFCSQLRINQHWFRLWLGTISTKLIRMKFLNVTVFLWWFCKDYIHLFCLTGAASTGRHRETLHCPAYDQSFVGSAVYCWCKPTEALSNLPTTCLQAENQPHAGTIGSPYNTIVYSTIFYVVDQLQKEDVTKIIH